MKNSVHVKAFAKVNLHLKVMPKNMDGYHNIESLFQIIPLFDELEICEVPKRTDCRVSVKGMKIPQKNTLTDAFHEFCSYTGLNIGIKIKLIKNIPSGAGLGGGSSDAAAVLKALNIMFNVGLSQDELVNISTKVGSDVAFFLYDGCAIVTGRGEKIKQIPSRKDMYFVLVYPKIHSSTKEAYSLVDEYMSQYKSEDFIDLSLLEDEYTKNVRDWHFANSFTEPISFKFPIIKNVIMELNHLNCPYVQMTGSGSSVYGVFNTLEDAKNAYNELYKKWKRFIYFLPPMSE